MLSKIWSIKCFPSVRVTRSYLQCSEMLTFVEKYELFMRWIKYWLSRHVVWQLTWLCMPANESRDPALYTRARFPPFLTRSSLFPAIQLTLPRDCLFVFVWYRLLFCNGCTKISKVIITKENYRVFFLKEFSNSSLWARREVETLKK